jgi:hypothetical protein
VTCHTIIEVAFGSKTKAMCLLRRRTAFVVLSLGAGSAIRAFGHALSILRLGFPAAGGLGRRYPILILVSRGAFARLRVIGSRRLTIAANCLTTCVLNAVRLA